jgi:hypothetical protein
MAAAVWSRKASRPDEGRLFLSGDMTCSSGFSAWFVGKVLFFADETRYFAENQTD